MLVRVPELVLGCSKIGNGSFSTDLRTKHNNHNLQSYKLWRILVSKVIVMLSQAAANKMILNIDYKLEDVLYWQITVTVDYDYKIVVADVA